MITPQRETRQQHEQVSSAVTWLMSAVIGFALLPGCVTAEKYEAEKTRALNFQRLLAQEENRADELNTQLQEAKIEIDSLGSQKNELTIQLDSLKEQSGRQQPADPFGSDLDMSDSIGESDDMSFSETSLSELGLPDLAFDESDFQDMGLTHGGEPAYHTVVAGETLYRLSRTYGVTIDQLKQWNNLTDNIISIGQRLIVSTP